MISGFDRTQVAMIVKSMTKHELLAQILQRLGLSIEPTDYSKGSTVTRYSLAKVLYGVISVHGQRLKRG